MLKATRAELRKLNAVESLEGRQAVLLATRIADPGETGQSVARLSDQLMVVMRDLRGRSPVADDVDRAKDRAETALRLLRGGA